MSFDIQPSSDGGKWGIVKRNDTDFTVTGIYGDLKVIKLLITYINYYFCAIGVFFHIRIK